jgi:uncharacterized protein YbjT (DUF2867 family)
VSTQSSAAKKAVITGAFSYTGKYATRLLLSRGYGVRTLTNHPRQNEFGQKVEVFPCNFREPEKLEQSLRGAYCLINTYWIRFPHARATFAAAVRNTVALIDAAKKVGVRRIVHVSIANPSIDSPLAYYRGKAQVEQAVLDSGLAYTILRPAVIFGLEDILINNIAWFVRHLPVFGIPGDGRYGIRPICVEDMANLIVDSIEEQNNEVINAVGPENFTFEELIRRIALALNKPARVVHVPTLVAYLFTRFAGLFVRDVVLTWEEYKGLMANLLAPEGPAAGKTQLTEWLSQNRERLGLHYASELSRHY